jgi:hypothetical protein
MAHSLPVIASEAKQSSFLPAARKLDCFVASLLAMTVINTNNNDSERRIP